MINWKLDQIREEFKHFTPPSAFAGGCMKSSVIGFCVQLRPDGKVGKIEENCENYETCKKGYKFQYN